MNPIVEIYVDPPLCGLEANVVEVRRLLERNQLGLAADTARFIASYAEDLARSIDEARAELAAVAATPDVAERIAIAMPIEQAAVFSSECESHGR